MGLLTVLLTSGLPEEFAGQTEMPGYFLQAVSTETGIRCVRAMAVVLLITVIGGWKYYEAHSSKEDRQQKSEEE